MFCYGNVKLCATATEVSNRLSLGNNCQNLGNVVKVDDRFRSFLKVIMVTDGQSSGVVKWREKIAIYAGNSPNC